MDTGKEVPHAQNACDKMTSEDHSRPLQIILETEAIYSVSWKGDIEVIPAVLRASYWLRNLSWVFSESQVVWGTELESAAWKTNGLPPALVCYFEKLSCPHSVKDLL